jgi:hypothetical protein
MTAAKPSPIPDSYRRITPGLVVQDAVKAPEFYGERDAFIIDPFGHGWTVATHIEDVSQQEMAQRLTALFG